MNPVKQEDDLGCAVACVAFVLGVSYREALKLFKDGPTRVKSTANFYCPEIVEMLNSKGMSYEWKRLVDTTEKEVYCDYSIVFIRRSKNYPYGHFLARYDNKWMDPWINLPDRNISSGFRESLPGEPTYVIYSTHKLGS